MTTIQVKPAPSLSPAAARVIVHPVSGGLLDPAGKVPADGRPWLYDGFTCRMLTDGAVLRADDPAFQVSPDPDPAVAPGPATPDQPTSPLPAADNDPAK